MVFLFRKIRSQKTEFQKCRKFGHLKKNIFFNDIVNTSCAESQGLSFDIKQEAQGPQRSPEQQLP